MTITHLVIPHEPDSSHPDHIPNGGTLCSTTNMTDGITTYISRSSCPDCHRLIAIDAEMSSTLREELDQL